MTETDRADRYHLDALGVPATLAAYENAMGALNGPLSSLPTAPAVLLRVAPGGSF